MNVSKMNHAMLSFALMGGMLVGSKPSSTPKTPKPSSKPSNRK